MSRGISVFAQWGTSARLFLLLLQRSDLLYDFRMLFVDVVAFADVRAKVVKFLSIELPFIHPKRTAEMFQ